MAQPVDVLGSPLATTVRLEGVRSPAGAPQGESGPTRQGQRQASAPLAALTRPTPPTPSFRLEFEQDRPVLKLHDRHGLLIYQVPPAGALMLIRLEEERAARLHVQA